MQQIRSPRAPIIGRDCRVDLSPSALGDNLPGVPGPGMLDRLTACLTAPSSNQAPAPAAPAPVPAVLLMLLKTVLAL